MTSRFALRSLLTGCAVLSVSLFAQSRTGTSTGTPTSGTTGGRGTGTLNNPTIPTTQGTSDLQRPIILMGKVIMDDGTPPPESLALQLACGGTPRSVGFTDSKGRFSLDLSNRQNSALYSDATQSGMNSRNNGLGGGGLNGSLNQNQNSGITERSLMGCDLIASLPGFRSDRVNLSNHHSLDNFDVGSLVLHRLANVQGLTISATSALAPKDAKKAYEKGQAEEKKGKLDNAGADFAKAVDVYPKYAAAWYALGLVRQRQGNADGARQAYQKSLEADSHFVVPYQELAFMAARESRWDDVETNTDRLLRLNPVDFPQAWYYNALANYELQKFDLAEKSAVEGLHADPNHRILKMDQLLGAILFAKKNYPAAAEHLKAYLKLAPDASDAEQVRKQVAELDRASDAAAQAAKQKP